MAECAVPSSERRPTFTPIFARVSRSRDFERGSYSGDPDDLRGSRSVRDLFDPGRMASLRQDLEDRVVEEAARRFGERAFREVLARVP